MCACCLRGRRDIRPAYMVVTMYHVCLLSQGRCDIRPAYMMVTMYHVCLLSQG